MIEYFVRISRFTFYSELCKQPWLVIGLFGSIVTFTVASATAFWQWREQTNADDEFQSAILQARNFSKKPIAGLKTRAELPEFDSAQLVDALHDVANDIKLPIDEVSYALENTAGQPYLRYRVTLSVTANYPTIRKFADTFRKQAEHVSLDTISCSREDIAATTLNCDLGLSAFYRKAERG
jgi:hypothetical protein